ncbi:MAG: serine/threonine-protein phosphatase [Anaerolineaceae bacterium]|nr:serine/threonine-protein phosphatase [Anaerolineaceae bacterium]
MDYFRKWFGKKEPVKSAASDVQTAPLSEEQLKTVSAQIITYHPPQILVGCAQSIGMQRDHNEDTLFVFYSIFADGMNDIPVGIFIVADGMGGHQNGEAASGAAVKAMGGTLVKNLYLQYLGIQETGGQSLMELMEEGVKSAQQSVLRKAPGGGTTLSTALLFGDQLSIAHVGDSRIYFLHPDGRVQILTQDHSLVHRLVELGQISEEEAMVHPQKNVLYRAVGQTDPYKADIHTHQIPRPGHVLLCSDGLWGVVPEADIFKIIKNAANPSAACHQLVEAANNAGGPDNITAILIQYLP